MKRLYEIDLLRIIAALAVVIFHYTEVGARRGNSPHRRCPASHNCRISRSTDDPEPALGFPAGEGSPRAMNRTGHPSREVDMSTPQEDQDGATDVVKEPTTLMKREVVVIPVADVHRALRFYQGSRWRLDADYEAGPKFRIVQLTPPRSACSIRLGRGLTPATPGTAQGTCLVVSAIDQAHADLISRGAG